MSCSIMVQKTLTFDERVLGWTSFHSYLPEWMVGLNNRFYTFLGGDLFLHHEEDQLRNNYYGSRYPTKVSVMINESDADVKVFKTLVLAGNVPWAAIAKGYITSTDDYSQTSLSPSQFLNKEGFWYAALRRDAISNKTNSKATYGIGNITGFTSPFGLTFSMDMSHLIYEGDNLYNTDNDLVGKVLSVNGENVQLESAPVNVVVGSYVYGEKDRYLEGGQIRGYTMRVDLEIDTDDKVELHAVTTEVFKSSYN